ncbi:MAG TPA: nicotinate-nucleotide adenylyltransferase [Acidimicrobiales bacterium]|nr:nicotinate-nucleotide adenylyltransferase [Acidimicrobiales bacterium]
MPGERLGVFGGTFDPVHVGHLVAAVNARHVCRLDRVLLVVANRPWQKQDRAVTPAEHRLALVEAAVEGCTGLEASRLEIDRGGETYTADTLETLAAEDPGRELFLIVGGDVAAELDSWRRIDVVRDLATLVVVTRPGAPQVDPGPGWRVARVDIPLLDLSGSDLRERAARGLPLDHLVPAGAIDRIRALNLYAGGR